MGKPLKKPPVYFTVAQARFNALLKLGDYLPAIQEGFRKAGYPAFTQHGGIAIQLVVVQDGQQPVPQPVPHEQHMFGNAEQTHSFVLQANALTFQSTNYGTFEAFSQAFLKGLEMVHDVVKLDYTERVGLRYLDQVSSQPGEALESYLAPEVQGLSSRLGGQGVHSFSETLSTFGEVKLLSRVVIQDKGLAFPPDLRPEGMSVQSRFVEVHGRHAILDTDGFMEGRNLFSLDLVNAQLHEIHDIIGAAFKATVTEHALATWDN